MEKYIKIQTHLVYVALTLSLTLTGCGSPESGERSGVPSDSVAPPVRSAGYLQTALTDLKDGSVEKALHNLQRQIAAEPRDPRAYLILGRIYINAGEHRHAQQLLTQASSQLPRNGTVHLLLAESYDKSGMLSMAITSAKQSILIFKQQEDALNFRKAVAVLQMLQNKESQEGQSI